MIGLLLVACAPGPFTVEELVDLDPMRLVPPDAEEDPAQVALGRALYTETRFSRPVGAGVAVSCDTCHDLCLEEGCADPLDGDASGADPRRQPLSAGAAGSTSRNSPTVLDAALRPQWGWVGRFCDRPDHDGLQEQILFPFESPGAYNAPSHCDLALAVSRLHEDAYTAAYGPIDHEALLAACFPRVAEAPYATRIRADVGDALAAFVRTLIDADTPLDRALDGDPDALDAAAIRGAKVFVGKGHCVECHSGPLLSDGRFHNVGVPGPDLGRADAKALDCGGGDPAEAGRFQTPSLRGVGRTGPYMHDGSMGSLWEVIAHYDQGGQRDGVVGEVDPQLRPLGLDRGERDDLEAFLLALGPPP